MLELNSQQRGALELLLEPLAHHLVVPVALAGRAPSRSWADAADSPSAGVLWDLVNGLVFCCLAEPVDGAIRKLGEVLRTEMLPAACRKGYGFVHVELDPHQMLPHLRESLEGFQISEDSMLFYRRLPGDGRSNGPRLDGCPEGFSLQRLTAGLLSSNLANMEEIRRCVDACWRDRERYLDDGLGYCLVQGGTVHSWCSTDYVWGGAADFYVETFGEQQGHGLATSVASACADECLAAGLAVHWHCWSSNSGSARVAEKLGLELVGSCPALRIDLPHAGSENVSAV